MNSETDNSNDVAILEEEVHSAVAQGHDVQETVRQLTLSPGDSTPGQSSICWSCGESSGSDSR